MAGQTPEVLNVTSSAAVVKFSPVKPGVVLSAAEVSTYYSYKIRYTEASGDEQREEIIPYENTTVTLQNLKPGTEYNVTIVPIRHIRDEEFKNKKEEAGGPSKSATFRTSE